jgi:plastocyanin domain-containing protein
MRSSLVMALVVAAIGSVSSLGALGCHKGDSGVMNGGVVPIMVGDDGFKPSSVAFKKGSKASLVFTRTSDDTCATEVVFPSLNIKKELPLNKPVTVDIPTDADQKLTFQCGMGMYKSSVLVTSK